MVNNNNNNEKKLTILMGDIHGEFMVIPYLIKQNDIRDANIIQLGDFGMGFHKPGYYKDTFFRLNQRLVKRNCHLYAFRGNHDDPEWFKETNNPFEYTNITLLSDYSELDLLGEKFLCIGGAVSIDRTHRVEGKSWWSNEGVILKEEKLVDLQGKYDYVLTHTRPLLGSPYGLNTQRIREWIRSDEKLKEDLQQEGILMNKIWEATKPKNWFYGHFHESQQYQTLGTNFRCLTINELYHIQNYV